MSAESPFEADGQLGKPEVIEIAGEVITVDEEITIGSDGDLIVGTVESVERSVENDHEILIVIKDISFPEKYIRRTGNFIYSEYTKRWKAQER